MSIVLINRVYIVSVNDSEQWKLNFVHVLKHACLYFVNILNMHLLAVLLFFISFLLCHHIYICATH